MMEFIAVILAKVLETAILVVALATAFALFTMLFWNWLMPSIFSLPEISFMQAWGINVLSGLIFHHSSSSNNQ